MTDQTPATEAGRSLLAGLEAGVTGHWTPANILAYEAGREDGRADALREAADAVRALPLLDDPNGDTDAGWLDRPHVERAAVLAVLDPEAAPSPDEIVRGMVERNDVLVVSDSEAAP